MIAEGHREVEVAEVTDEEVVVIGAEEEVDSVVLLEEEGEVMEEAAAVEEVVQSGSQPVPMHSPSTSVLSHSYHLIIRVLLDWCIHCIAPVTVPKLNFHDPSVLTTARAWPWPWRLTGVRSSVWI